VAAAILAPGRGEPVSFPSNFTFKWSPRRAPCKRIGDVFTRMHTCREAYPKAVAKLVLTTRQNARLVAVATLLIDTNWDQTPERYGRVGIQPFCRVAGMSPKSSPLTNVDDGSAASVMLITTMARFVLLDVVGVVG